MYIKMVSKHKIRKSRRYGDKTAYFENLWGKIQYGSPGQAGDAVHSGLNNPRVNLSRDFIGFLEQRNPDDARTAERVISRTVARLRIRNTF
jgi:hypothetical protein